MRFARWMTVAAITVGLTVGAISPAQAHHKPEHTIAHAVKDVKKALEKNACGDVGGLGVVGHDCEKTRETVVFLLGIAGEDPVGDVQRFLAENLCGDVGGLGVVGHDCEKTRETVEFILGLAG